MVSTLLYNLVMVGVDVFVLTALARRPTAIRSLVALAAVGGAALVVALLFERRFFGFTRLVAYGVFLHLVILLVSSAWLMRRSSRLPAVVCVFGAVLIGGVAVDAFLIERTWIEVTRLRLRSDKIGRAIRIAVIADLQTDVIGAYERRVLKRVMQEKPDLILMAGDYLHQSDNDEWRRLRTELNDLLREIRFGAPLGVYAVCGNTDWPAWPSIFGDLRVTAFEETGSVDVADLRITGLTLRDSFDTTCRVDAAPSYHIVLGHAPDFALGDVQADLLVAGHTHGGQVRIPGYGPLVTFSRVPRAWATGATNLGDSRTLVVSRGIGMERGRAPRLRFACRPELVFIDVTPNADIAGDSD